MKIRLIDFGIKESGVEAPFAKHYNDAGSDVRSTRDYTVSPQSVKKIPLGFGVEIPDGMMGLIFPRSGLNSKGITIYYSPIDSGYRGEVSAIVYNSTLEFINIEKGDRIGQLVVVPFIQTDFVWETGEERGEGGFGSTGLS